MQLSLSSVPSELSSLPAAAGASSDTPASPQAAAEGFADVLAEVTPGAAPATPPAAAAIFVNAPARPAEAAAARFIQPAGIPSFLDGARDPARPSLIACVVSEPPAGNFEDAESAILDGRDSMPRRGERSLSEISDLQSIAALVLPAIAAPEPVPAEVTIPGTPAELSGDDLVGGGDIGTSANRDPAPRAGEPAPRCSLPATHVGEAADTGFVRSQPARSDLAPASTQPATVPHTARLTVRDVIAETPAPTPATEASAGKTIAQPTLPATAPAISAAEPAELRATPGFGRTSLPATPATPVAGRTISATEKIAADVSFSDGRAVRDALSERPKTFIDTAVKRLTRFESKLGIDGAFPGDTMPSGATQVRSIPSETPTVPNSAPVADAGNERQPLPHSVSLTSTAHRAVEAALSVTERFSARDQSSVNLRFSIGGNDLNVHVQLRGGEVQTTFRTDSADLRAALSTEWQAVAAQNQADRPNRLAPPVITSNQDAGMSFSGESSGRQRQQESSAPSFVTAGAMAATRATRAMSGSAMPTSNAPVRADRSNALHLHTLA